MTKAIEITNPFRPGAGQRPPYLAGRHEETGLFQKLLKQSVVMENPILTGLRGVGKTVLMEQFKPLAQREGWLWVGTDLSESVSISEEKLAERLIVDLSVATQNIVVHHETKLGIGFNSDESLKETRLGYDVLLHVYRSTPGLVSDKIKAVFHIVADYVRSTERRGIVFAYDEAQNLADHAAKDQYPLSLLLEVFQSIQRQDVPFMLLLVGLPTLFPKLVEARTYAERMFRVIFLQSLNRKETEDAIIKPIQDTKCPIKPTAETIDLLYKCSGGYPYFIQYMCRDAFDVWLEQMRFGQKVVSGIPLEEVIRKLDNDFFAGRWSRITDRQQELLAIIAGLDNADAAFTIQDIMGRMEGAAKPFSRSSINQMLSSLIGAGLVYKDRHGKYLFAVPLMAGFIRRNTATAPDTQLSLGINA